MFKHTKAVVLTLTLAGSTLGAATVYAQSPDGSGEGAGGGMMQGGPMMGQGGGMMGMMSQMIEMMDQCNRMMEEHHSSQGKQAPAPGTNG